MDKRDFYDGRKIMGNTDMDPWQDDIDEAVRRVPVTDDLTGIKAGLGVSETTPESMNVEVAQGVAWDKDGERCYIASTQTVDCTHDELGASIAIPGGGNIKWVSLYLHFDRAESQPDIDNGGSEVFWMQAESFTIRVVQGNEAPAPPRPGLHASDLKLCDIKFYNGMTEIDDADIWTDAREDFLRTRNGDSINTVLAALQYLALDKPTYAPEAFSLDDDFSVVPPVAWWAETKSASVAEVQDTSKKFGVDHVTLQISGVTTPDWEILSVARAGATNCPLFEVTLSLGDEESAEWNLYIGCGTNSDFAAGDGFGFLCENNANWQCLSSVGGVITDEDTGVAVAASTTYVLRAALVSGKVKFWINDVLVREITTNLPSSDAMRFFARFIGITAASAEYDLFLDRYAVAAWR